MRNRIYEAVRILILILILPLLAIFFSPPHQVNASCPAVYNQPIKVDNGLISAINPAPFAAVTNVSCVIDQRATIPQFSILPYDNPDGSDSMIKNYFDQAKSSFSKTPLPGNQTQTLLNSPIDLSSVDKLYRVTGNLTIDNDITVKNTGVVFVDGDLYINHDLTNTNAITGIVFVVQGTIYIERGVTTVNAFLIAHTGFCSAYDGTLPPTCADYPDLQDVLRNYLTINGSIISLNAAVAPQFVRKKATATNSSETINYEPKYLVILKDTFSRDLKIWREIQ